MEEGTRVPGDYPRPQLVRENWTNLNGRWDFAFDDENAGEAERWYETFPQKARGITVPFTCETALGGIGDETMHPVVWYRKTIVLRATGQRRILHFEGVDYEAKVWVNGRYAGSHAGGYARFSMDITELLAEGDNTVTVRAEDGMSCARPRGKQRWKKESFGCWYVQTTGIWKTVWMEEVPAYYIESIKITPDLDQAKVRLEVKLNRVPEETMAFSCEILSGGRRVNACTVPAAGEYLVLEMGVARQDVPWDVQVWSPEHPALYDVELTLSGGQGQDRAAGYFGMRKISVEGGKVLLNNRPLYQRLILDQGYWEESGLTPPSEEALQRDIDLVLAAGFNGVRKHQKVEDERFFYQCDKKGLLVWCEMPSAYLFHDDAVEQFTRQWMEIVRQNYNHPCIITWTPFNESWGIERVFTDVGQQHFTKGIYHMTKAYDAMRPVIVNDGWEHTVSDIVTLHDYEESGEVFAERYREKDAVLGNAFPFNNSRYAMAKGCTYRGQPVLISEYGGIAFRTKDGWGYGEQVEDEESFLERFRKITDAVRGLEYSVGFCYTQLTDVYQEVNGLYTMGRQPKVEIERIREIVTGKQSG